MRTPLHRFLVSACCLIGFGFLGLWIRSHYTSDFVVFTWPDGRYVEFATIPEQFRVAVVDRWAAPLPITRFTTSTIPAAWPVFGQGLVRQHWYPLGFAITSGFRKTLPIGASAPIPMSYRLVSVPFALPVSLLAAVTLLPAAKARFRQRRQIARRAAGLCPLCGYDLRATPGKCPECGNGVDPAEGVASVSM